ncbi:MAG: sialate O-acetylesterase, partial [Verrucomicrobiota bacterium]
MLRLLLSISALVLICTTAIAENQLSIARLFTDHMVLQQGRETHIWGKAAPETGVSVSFAGQSLKVKTNENGDWVAKFSALSTNAKGSTLTVSSGDQKIEISDVLVGEVWMCSGQSNMGWAVSRSHNAEEEIANAKHPKIRLFQTHNKTSTTAHTDYTTGEHWQICSPETIATFSAVGYYFGRELSQNLNVPIGLINTAWGGKPSEAFTTREKLASTETGKDLLGYWDSLQAQYDPDTAQSRYDQALATFQEKQKAAR